jgi:hypothetical protein
MDAARVACTQQEWEIVHRKGTSKLEDERDLDTIRKICDGIYDSLERLHAILAQGNR